ncbi:7487_t:CDS:2 [Dentiscutata heterogama]|uniref:7487_t:CDS:1 n=1 Tax=Dentiscutata heterogama TaxID=1316150 RepID=A0ACA9LRY3_9GLOM|nr:7487_t:CDS:2 [Dentiscutata heterogama]
MLLDLFQTSLGRTIDSMAVFWLSRDIFDKQKTCSNGDRKIVLPGKLPPEIFRNFIMESTDSEDGISHARSYRALQYTFDRRKTYSNGGRKIVLPGCRKIVMELRYIELERSVRKFLELERFSRWSLSEAKEYVSTNVKDANYSTEEIFEIFKRELRMKANDCNLYKSARDKANNLFRSLTNSGGSNVNDEEGQETFCDVTIEVLEQTFKAHSLVLCSRSTFFNKILSSENHSFYKITLPDIMARSFELLLKYLYSGTISLEGLRPVDIFDLYYAASKL